jgi:predicted nucleic acid-binding protein
MKNAILDSGYWFGLYFPTDTYHQQANDLADSLLGVRIVVPWPILYETVATKFAKSRDAMTKFEKVLKSPSTLFLDDQPYRQNALDLCFEGALRPNHPRPLSLVDCVIRLMLDDVNNKIDGLITFNIRDFADVCRVRRIEVLPY